MEMLNRLVVEIAEHVYTYDNKVNSLIKGTHYLRNVFIIQVVIGIESTCSEFALSTFDEGMNIFQHNNVGYLRISNDKKMTLIQRGARKLSVLLHNLYLYYFVNKDLIATTRNDFIFHRVPVLRINKIKEVKVLIEHLINQKTKWRF
jgi:hypothetical protein